MEKGQELLHKSTRKSKKVYQSTYSGPIWKPKKYTAAKLTNPPTVKCAPRNKTTPPPAPNFEGITPIKSTTPEPFTPQSMAAHHTVSISSYQEVMNKERDSAIKVASLEAEVKQLNFCLQEKDDIIKTLKELLTSKNRHFLEIVIDIYNKLYYNVIIVCFVIVYS